MKRPIDQLYNENRVVNGENLPFGCPCCFSDFHNFKGLRRHMQLDNLHPHEIMMLN